MLALRITILALRDNFSGLNNSNVNKVIRAVLNSLFFFFTKRIRTHQKHKTLQANKNENALKNIKGEKSHLLAFLCFLCA